GPPGLRHSTLDRLPDGEPTCCEHEWTVRMLHYHPASVVPRRMYFSACDTDTKKPSMFASLSLGENRKLSASGGRPERIRSRVETPICLILSSRAWEKNRYLPGYGEMKRLGVYSGSRVDRTGESAVQQFA
ncbi:MAG: hypothetical protein RIF32_12315, partial [Leptospirales bacterium]